jgi:formate-dependent nitrite reductase membrane component NrfD
MANSYGGTKKKPIGVMLLFGIGSFALYAALLMEQDMLNEYFGRGGFYAFFPIVIAFVFSFIHGTFTGKFWTVLGIEAAKREKEVR